MEKFLDIKEVSELLSIKQSTLRAWIFAGKLPVVRLGRLVRIRESALADWIKSQEGRTNGAN
jgi:excisionase family DNA binding protein